MIYDLVTVWKKVVPIFGVPSTKPSPSATKSVTTEACGRKKPTASRVNLEEKILRGEVVQRSEEQEKFFKELKEGKP